MLARCCTCCWLQAALAAKTDQQAATAARCGDLEVQLARAIEQGTANSQRLAALKVRNCGTRGSRYSSIFMQRQSASVAGTSILG